jgi:hypothetical protein
MAVLSYTIDLMETDVRRLLQEDTAARYSETDLFRWINEGELFIAAATRCLRTSTTAASVSGTEEYAIPGSAPGAWAITRVDYDGTTLEPTPFEKRREAVREVAPDTNNTPQVWAPYGQKYVLAPPPDTAGDEIKVWHAYMPDAMVTTESLTIPIIYGSAVILYAAHKGLMMKGQFDRAQQVWQEFLFTMRSLSNKGIPDLAKEVAASAG